jgi:hypothetical protein
MLWRTLLVLWALSATVAALYLGLGGTLSLDQAVDAAAALIAAGSLWAVVRIPWDLYFRARHVVATQRDGAARAIDVRAEERAESVALARRLLAFAVGLHLLGATACAGLALATDGVVGWVGAVAFVLTLGLRPAGAMVTHVRARLDVLQTRAQLPTVDAASLGARLTDAEQSLQRLQHALDHDEHGLSALHQRQQLAEASHARALAQQAARHQAELDRLGLEMQRALERLTTDQEVLSGLRAFLAMVRAT